MKERKNKYIPGNSYNQMKEILIKDWYMNRLLGLHSSEDITNITIYDISESNIKCEYFTI